MKSLRDKPDHDPAGDEERGCSLVGAAGNGEGLHHIARIDCMAIKHLNGINSRRLKQELDQHTLFLFSLGVNKGMPDT